jgi:hypothetical protein
MTSGEPTIDAGAKRTRAATQRFEAWARKPYVQGLPEWAMFPDEETRRRAIVEIERGMMPRSLKSVLQFLLAVALFLAVPAVVSFLLTHIALPPMGQWNDRIMWGMILVGYTILVYLAIRKDMPRELRKRLLECGVPVCLGCGYDLRGQPSSSTRCPECGRTFEAKTMTLIQKGPGESSVDAAAAGSSRE